MPLPNRHARRALALAGLLALAPAARADTITLGADRDNTLFEEPDGSRSNGADPSLYAGVITLGTKRRALIRFDLSALPRKAVVEGVTLTLRMSRTMADAEPMTLHRVLADWGEGTSSGGAGMGAPSTPGDATWIHTFFAAAFWATPGGDFVPTASATRVVENVGFYTWGATAGMTADVQGWVRSPASNFGWILVGDEAGGRSAKRFDSRTSPTPAYRPALQITYSVPPAREADDRPAPKPPRPPRPR